MRVLLALSTLALSACMSGPNYVRPSLPLADAFRAAPNHASPGHAGAPLWTMFHDPVLDRLEAKALTGNLSIASALDRLDQARTAVRGRVAALHPAGLLDGNAARLRQSENAGLGQLSRYTQALDQLTDSGSSSGLARTVDNYQINSGVSWDIDFAGGLRRQAQAAHAKADAAAAGVEVARLTVSAELADAYLAYRGAANQVTVLDRLNTAAQARMAIMAARVRLGAVPASALDEARAEGMRTAGAVSLAQALRDAQANRIAVLIGQSPSLPVIELDGDAPVPVADAFGTGVPADLLRWRPDLIVAENKLAAANAQIGVALAEYYPHVTLSALFGFNSARLSNLFTGSSALVQGGGALRWRLFDFGRVDAQVKVSRGVAREALADYRSAVLRASEEVETGFAQARAQALNADVMAQRRDALAAAAGRADAALAKGAQSQDSNIMAHAALDAAEADLITARTDAGRAAIGARRALGR